VRNGGKQQPQKGHSKKKYPKSYKLSKEGHQELQPRDLNSINIKDPEEIKKKRIL